ncbi:hypothetical protein TNCV_2761331 [Trichonephila clavipes]|nr:hypothetical protein TNCV_2761331 [Trichonephila clavipes]
MLVHILRVSPNNVGYDVLPWPARSALSFANRAPGRWEGNCSRPEIQENSLRRCKDYGRIFRGVKVILNRCHAEFRLV